ncbi:arylsulfatase [Chakrabartia godavariana]|nr:arylsulfatase [Chakrabartia godavariana]
MKRAIMTSVLFLGAAASAQQMSVPAGLTVGSMSRVSPVLKAERQRDNFEPALLHPDQARAAQAKLEAIYKRTGKRPNILIFVVDDLGYGDVGAYGGGESLGAPTPHIDRLAREGLKLTSTYAQPSCTPTRAALNTGRLPVRSGLLTPKLLNDTADISSELLAAKVLSGAGYRTALSGKWHLGEKDGSRPWQVGFDEFTGFLGVANAYQEEHPSSPDVVNDPELLAELRSMPASRDLWSATKEGGGKSLGQINWANSRDLDQKFAAFSEDFIRRSVKAGKPFYLSHNFSKVHYFNEPSKAFVGRSATKDVYRDSVIEVDDIVGRLTKLLEDLKIADNTLVFFTSDNGPEEDSYPESGTTPFRGAKGTTLEGGVRVPGIFWWPGMIKPGRVSDGLFDMTDMFNTSLAVAGVDVAKAVPADRYIDGIDQSSFLLADNGESAREAVYFWNADQFAGARWRYYKMAISEIQVGTGSVRDFGGLDNAQVITPLNGFMYNLYLDPKERKSVLIEKAWVPSYALGPLLAVHGATMVKYPPKAKVRFR